MRPARAPPARSPTGPPASWTTRWNESRSERIDRGGAVGPEPADPVVEVRGVGGQSHARQIERDTAEAAVRRVGQDLAIEERRRGQSVEQEDRSAVARGPHEPAHAGGDEGPTGGAMGLDERGPGGRRRDSHSGHRVIGPVRPGRRPAARSAAAAAAARGALAEPPFEAERGEVRHDDADDDQRADREAAARRQHRGDDHRRERQLQERHHHHPHPHRDRGASAAGRAGATRRCRRRRRGRSPGTSDHRGSSRARRPTRGPCTA